ncbi:MAG: HlyD family secretion protein [Planctomycetes bacterium]|nr:HlyD family secretion protein [Planctomycetota bacterium]
MSSSSIPEPNPSPPSPKPGLVRRIWSSHLLRLLVVVGVTVLVATPFAVTWLSYRLSHSITDDAFVESHIVNIGPQQVSGHIVRILVEEHDKVEAGQLLVEIDPTPYRDQVELLRAKLQVAEAQASAEEASLVRLRAEVPHEIEIARKALAAALAEQARDDEFLKFTAEDVAKALKEAQATLDSTQATFVLAEEEHKRFTTLYKESAVPERRAQEAIKAFNANRAEVKLAEARVARAQAAEMRVDVARQSALAAAHQGQKAARALELAETKNLRITEMERLVEVKKKQVDETQRSLDVASTNLGYTRIVAPFPGVVVKRYRHLGDYAPVGTPILSLYNPELTYVTAHLEETKLEGVAPGNEVRLDVDAFSEPFRGRVVWINRATGANFALVPRNLSSGEFTKVVQRVPVRIWIERDERWPQLRAGLSVTVSIAHGPGDAEWARREAQAMLELESKVKK